MNPFQLHPNLQSKIEVLNLPLCQVLLENNANYPWLFLVPQINEISKIMDLSLADQQQLLIEMDLAQKVLWNLFRPHQINVAAIGNKTPQLHVHVIARFKEDPAWPGTVWDHQYPIRPYDEQSKEVLLKQLRDQFSILASSNLTKN